MKDAWLGVLAFALLVGTALLAYGVGHKDGEIAGLDAMGPSIVEAIKAGYRHGYRDGYAVAAQDAASPRVPAALRTARP